jgi:hypothetical protein
MMGEICRVHVTYLLILFTYLILQSHKIDYLINKIHESIDIVFGDWIHKKD